MASIGTVTVKVKPDLSAFKEVRESEIASLLSEYIYGGGGPNTHGDLTLCTRIAADLLANYTLIRK